MADVELILGQIDSGIDTYLPIIVQLEEKHLAENGEYWQGLFTHSNPPINESSEAPDQLGKSPTDQESSWNDIAGGTIPAEMLSRIRIDTYVSPSGQGFVVIAEKIIDGKTYSKSYNVGPELERSTEWIVISEE
tara:strand:- start:250 stop:651 length:402 start_codon:yes stop_codon:yes gene_type:complete